MAQEQRYRIPILVTLDDYSEEVRTFTVIAWSENQAVEIAKKRAREDERVVEVKAEIR